MGSILSRNEPSDEPGTVQIIRPSPRLGRQFEIITANWASLPTRELIEQLGNIPREAFGYFGWIVLVVAIAAEPAVAQIATIGTGPWNASRRCWSAMMAEAENQETLEAAPENQDVFENEPAVQHVSEES
jgi:hypothetical protein